jgi:hypothetical protein
VDSVYGKLYAEKLDPFAEYKSGEKARGYAALRRTDRIVYKGSSWLLSRALLLLQLQGLQLLLWQAGPAPGLGLSHSAARQGVIDLFMNI